MATQDVTTEDSSVRVKTGTVDYDVTRTVSSVYGDDDAVCLDYLVTARESRYYDPVDFPLMYFTKEVESVSFDDGGLENFRTESNPTPTDMICSRALLLHRPKRDTTSVLLLDVNRPLYIVRSLGLVAKQSVSSWSRVFNFHQLWHEEFPFHRKGEQIGMRHWMKLVDGGAMTERKTAAVRKLA